MERFTETDCSKCGVPVNVDLDPQGDLVRYDDAQRALDAEREKVKELECYRALWKRRDDELTGVLAQLATLQARVKELERDNAAMKQLFNENPSALWGQLATLQAHMQTLRAENARLREALQLIVHGTQDEAPPWRCLGVTQMQVIARDALQPERGEP